MLYDLTTDEGIEAFNNRVPVNSDGTLYDEKEDAKFMKRIAKVMRLPNEDYFEKIDAKFSKAVRDAVKEAA